jgi:hypothetical protein
VAPRVCMGMLPDYRVTLPLHTDNARGYWVSRQPPEGFPFEAYTQVLS